MQLAGYKMRPIEKQDLDGLFNWRNSEKIHSMMLTNHKITLKEHIRWYEQNRKNSASMNFIFEWNGRAIGYIGYTDYDARNKRCAPGVYIGESDNIPINAGGAIGYMSLKYAFDVLNCHKVSTVVLEKNKVAYKLNKFLGYKEEGYLKEHFFKNGSYENGYIMSILDNEWESKRTRIERLYK